MSAKLIDVVGESGASAVDEAPSNSGRNVLAEQPGQPQAIACCGELAQKFGSAKRDGHGNRWPEWAEQSAVVREPAGKPHPTNRTDDCGCETEQAVSPPHTQHEQGSRDGCGRLPPSRQGPQMVAVEGVMTHQPYGHRANRFCVAGRVCCVAQRTEATPLGSVGSPPPARQTTRKVTPSGVL